MIAQNTELPILYSFLRCPYAMRARMALHYSGIKIDIQEVELKNKPVEMLDISSKGTVPVLHLPKGTVIDESLEIMDWALNQNDPDNWQNCDKKEAANLITFNDTELKHNLDRYKYPDRYKNEDCSNAPASCITTIINLNDRLKNSKYLCGDHITMADIAIFPFIRQLAFTDKDWFNAMPVPKLQQWLDSHIGSALFTAIMQK